MIGGQQYRVPSLGAEEWMDKKFFFDTKSEMVHAHGVGQEEENSTRENIVKQVWMSHVKDEFDLASLIQTKAEFSFACSH